MSNAKPLSRDQRLQNYLKQSRRLSPRQLRQLTKTDLRREATERKARA